jgi:uncharacterized protein YjbI with pentapeptide repeats
MGELAATHAKADPAPAGCQDDTETHDGPICDGLANMRRRWLYGIRLDTTPKCLAHASDEERNAALKQLGETGKIDARGVPISTALVEQILAAAPHGADNRPMFRTTQFNRASFQGDALFEGATFQGGAAFNDATFQGDARFNRAAFRGGAVFNGVTFQGDARFNEATFQAAVFGGTTFQRIVSFDGATFRHIALFMLATFQGHAWFNTATFEPDARFDGATFQIGALFEDVTFQADAEFGGATFWDEAVFDRASFKQARRLGPFLAHRGLHLDEVQFMQPVQIEASTIWVCCRRARFAGGAQFRLRWARAVLDDSDLATPSILAGIPAPISDELVGPEQRIAKAWTRLLAEEISERPRLLSLQRANVAGLGLSSVELADCRFAGAHNLDQLRLEADVSFAAAPVWLRWDQRQVIAEERAWRAQRSRRWPSQWWPASAWLGNEPVLEAGQIAGLYRALRKGREDAKDEPGAADFYYGEMEMRRRARRTGEASRGRVERAILTAYWLVSGYGLRAWRALAWLLVAVMVATIGLRTVGFTHDRHPWSSAFLYTAGAVTHLVNPPEGLLTEPGQAIHIAIGLIGPLLLGLALLAVRARVKR